jgi:hypothetical protein
MKSKAIEEEMPGIDFDTWRVVRRGPFVGRRLSLATLRAACGLTQGQIAKRAKVAQSEISCAEARSDCHVSTLERYAAALGGELRLLIEIDGRTYPIMLAADE